jgi:hypothetical protein
MIIANIFNALFGSKKKKIVTPKPVKFTPPKPLETPNEDINDFGSQLTIFDNKRKELGQLQVDYNNYVLSSFTKTAQQKETRLQRYNTERAALIKNIQDRAMNLVRLFTIETVGSKKTTYSQLYAPIRKDLNDNFNNILVGTPYAMIFNVARNPVNDVLPTPTQTQVGVGINVGNVTTNPTTGQAQTGNVGEPQTQVGGQTNTTTQAPVNTGIYPNWENKMYLPNNTVYYQGHLYNSSIAIEGTNNNPPPSDGRWRLIL